MKKTPVNLLLVFIVLALVSMRLPAQSVADTMEARIYLNQATKSMTAASYEQAVSAAEQAVALNAGFSSGIDIEAANLLEDIGLAYFKARNMPAVVEAFEKALKVFQNTDLRKSVKVARLHNNLGIALRSQWELKRALYHFETSLAIRLELQKEPNIDIAKSHNNIGVVLSDLGRNLEALDHYVQSLDIKRNLPEVDTLDIAKTLGNIGGIYTAMKNTGAAFKYFEEVFQLIKNREDREAQILLGNYYNNTAALYNYRRDYYKAIQYHEQAIKIKKQVYGDGDVETLKSYENLSSVYMEIGEYDTSLALLSESEKLISQNELTGTTAPGSTFYRIGTIYVQQGRIAEAKQYLDKAQAIFVEVLTENNEFSAKYFESMGQAYLYEGDFISAIKSYHQKLKIERNISEGLLNSEILTTLLMLSNAHRNAGNREQAMHYVDEVFNLIKGYPENNPEIRFGQFEALLIKAELLALQDHKAARLYFEEALAMSEKFRDDLEDRYSKMDFLRFTNRVAQGLIQLYLNEGMATDVALQNAFVVAEKNKGFLLQEGFREAQALKDSALTDAIRTQEAGFRQDISYYEIQIYSERNADQPDERLILQHNEKLVQLNREYIAFKKKLENEYPNYYKLRYDRQVKTVTDIQNPSFLRPDQTLLEYFVGDTALYAFVIRPDTFAVFIMPNDFGLDSLVSQLRRGLFGYHTAPNKPDTLYSHTTRLFTHAAQELYERLLAPVQPLLTNHIVVVPDGVLGYIPFEALLMQKPAVPARYHEHRYLGKEHIVSYAYSATSLHAMRQKQHQPLPTGSVLAMAPFFRGDIKQLSESVNFGDALSAVRSDALAALPYSGEEAFRIAKGFKGQSLLGREATKAAFEQKAAGYRMIHLSTHGIADDRMGDFAWLSFAHPYDSTQFDKLYIRDIYDLRLNADLVVLSACEAGVGKLSRGEGIISLSRAFAYAGAKSIVTTLWSVNDERTKDFMLSFYRHLDQKTAAEALWEARRDFLSKRKGEAAHPYYWAGFIGIGNM